MFDSRDTYHTRSAYCRWIHPPSHWEITERGGHWSRQCPAWKSADLIKTIQQATRRVTFEPPGIFFRSIYLLIFRLDLVFRYLHVSTGTLKTTPCNRSHMYCIFDSRDTCHTQLTAYRGFILQLTTTVGHYIQ